MRVYDRDGDDTDGEDTDGDRVYDRDGAWTDGERLELPDDGDRAMDGVDRSLHE